MAPDSVWPATPAWLFVRDNQSVRLEARRLATGFELHICGPGARRQTLHAEDLTILFEQQAQFEGALLADGYTAVHSTSDRRKTPR